MQSNGFDAPPVMDEQAACAQKWAKRWIEETAVAELGGGGGIIVGVWYGLRPGNALYCTVKMICSYGDERRVAVSQELKREADDVPFEHVGASRVETL